MKSNVFFNSFVDLLEWEQSYATLNEKRVIDTSKRVSYICTKKFSIEFPLELKNFCKLCKIEIPENLELTLLKYEKGGFFAKHIDRKRGDRHAYTLLLFPPCLKNSKNWFRGGNLNVGTSVVNCSQIEHYTYLILNINIEHELETILEGTRYVFKSELYVQNDDVIVNSFPFTKEINRIFNIDVKKETQNLKIENTDNFPIDYDKPLGETTKNPKIRETLNKILQPRREKRPGVKD